MQASTKIGRVYASALFELAKAAGKVGVCYEDLAEINELYKTSKDFRDFFTSPIIDRQQKTQIIIELFKDKIDELVLNLLGVLIKKNREAALDNIFLAFRNYKDEAENKVYAQTFTAKPLDVELRDKLIDELKTHLKKEVVLEERVDESLIGGIIVRVSDSVIDGSIRNKLRRLRRSFRLFYEHMGE